MTPWESLLQSNNESSIIKQLPLIAFFILEYIYILSYHPWNPNSFNMDQILHTTQLEKDLLKIEKKITKYNYYKYNRKYPKGLTLKFNLALCENSDHLQKSCHNILRNASLKLRDHILTAVNKKFEDLKITRNGYLNALRNETSKENFQNICNNIKRQNQKLSSSIAERHRTKYLRDNIKFITINDTTESLGVHIEKDITKRESCFIRKRKGK